MVERVRINLHEYDRNGESILKGFRETAKTQGWTAGAIDTALAGVEFGTVNEILDRLRGYTEPDYSWGEMDEELLDDDYYDE